MTSLRLVFLGTGDAFNSGGRGSAGLWVEPRGGAPFLIDLGPTTIAALERLRLNPADIQKVFLTHLHGDHMAGWPFLLLHNAFAVPRRRPLVAYGPTGMVERFDALSRACYGDLLERERLPFPLECREIPVAPAAGREASAGIWFDVVPMDHHESSIGYRFHVGERCIGVTGDTRWCPAVAELSRGCDLLILECTTVEPQEHAHISLRDLRESGHRLESRRTILTHTTDSVARALAAGPIPGVTVADDRMELDL